MRRQWPAAVCLALWLAGCATLDPNAHADALANTAGLRREAVRTDRFVLTAFTRITRPDRPLAVYIEGDGLAWLSRSQPSLDPTPHEATGLGLAAADPQPNVAYLARPCQFTPMAANPDCGIPYWTGKRFAPEVVHSLDQALDRFAARVPGQRIDLVGYSGGGALAVLIAARRSDIGTIRTVAGNLDTAFVNRLHDVSPMPDSANPIDVAARVAAIPQIHFSGSADTVVPPAVAQRFVAAAGGLCAQTRSMPNVAHEGDWVRLWPMLRRSVPTCAEEPAAVRR
ncbi:alpha/beta hydrolase family protein [Paraburkholderia fungorum]|uniref:alpha/beta hydrolase family protein n=1 Tax=Paraburkholderia fungorum TaxID=134537 RepID=UPI0038B8264E